MNVLGLHFGHDAAVAVLCDGCTASYLVRERHNRAKHALSLDLSLIRLGLQDAGIGIADVDCVAICSTQGYGIVADDASSLAISLESHEGHGGQSTLARRFPAIRTF